MKNVALLFSSRSGRIGKAYVKHYLSLRGISISGAKFVEFVIKTLDSVQSSILFDKISGIVHDTWSCTDLMQLFKNFVLQVCFFLVIIFANHRNVILIHLTLSCPTIISKITFLSSAMYHIRFLFCSRVPLSFKLFYIRFRTIPTWYPICRIWFLESVNLVFWYWKSFKHNTYRFIVKPV